MASTPEMSTVESRVVGRSVPPHGKLSPGPGRSVSEVSAHQRARIHSAMVEAAANRGYATVTVRQITRLAGVSSRTFYKLFSSKEDCFLRTYELVARRAVERIAASQAGERGWEERLRLACSAFARELECEPQAARFVLVEAYSAGSQALERTQCTEGVFEAMIAENIARARGGTSFPPLILEGIVAGVAHIARANLDRGLEVGPSELGIRLAEWMLSFQPDALSSFNELDHYTIPRCLVMNERADRLEKSSAATQAHGDERGLILSAVGKLVTTDSPVKLTVPQILAAAGLQRRAFNQHFISVEDCFFALLELEIGNAVTHALRTRSKGDSWIGSLYHVFLALCTELAKNPLLNSACLADVLAPVPGKAQGQGPPLSEFVPLLHSAVPPSERPGRLATEASAGAIWGVIQRHAVSQRARQLPELAGALAVLALGPMVGAKAAVAAIQAERLA